MTNLAQAVTATEHGHNYEYKWIPIKQLKVDQYYQRYVTQSRIDKIIANWNYDLVNPPKVSMRDDGSYFIFDGQHTVVAYKEHEGEDALIYCKVFRGLTRHEETELFLQQNGISKAVTATEELRAMYNDNDKQVRSMVRDCELCGVTILFSCPGGGTHRTAKCRCTAPVAMLDAYTKMPRDLFVRMLDTLVKTWNGDGDSLTAGFIGGFQTIYTAYGEQFSDAEMIKSLGKFSASYYIREAKELSGRMKNRYCAIFLRIYNKNRTTRRIAVAGE